MIRNFSALIRYSGATLLLLLPLFAYPYFWLNLLGIQRSYWGVVTFAEPGVLALTALALILAAPERLWSSIKRSKLVRSIAIVTGLACGATLIQQLVYGGSPALLWRSWFILLMPWAGIALARELIKILPWYSAGLFIILVVATIRSSYCTGLPGNWNWNFSLLAITLPALLMVIHPSPKRFIAALLLVAVGVIGLFFIFPELAPRGTATGIIGASALLVLLSLPRKSRWVYGLLIAAGSFALFISTLNHPDTANIRDSRIQLWQGSLQFALAHPVLGVGVSRFESQIPPYLPPRYFLTDFPAIRHPHPHNEILQLWSGFGLAGLVLIALYLAAVLPALNWRYPLSLWFGWSFLLLLIHAQFDVLLMTPLIGTFFALLGGTLIADKHFPQPMPYFRVRQVLALLFLVFAGGLGLKYYQSTSSLRHGRIRLSQGDKAGAMQEFEKSLQYSSRPETLYFAGQVELFDNKSPDNALKYFLRIKNEWGFPYYLHLNNRIARAYAVKGELKKALHYFDLERQSFPFSAINAGQRLVILLQLKAGPELIQQAKNEFENNMEMRHLKPSDFPTLMKKQSLDDEPFVAKK